MKKYRKAYNQIAHLLDLKVYGVIILIGLRKTGKTKILKQLTEDRNGHYVDFRESFDSETAVEDYKNIFNVKNELILLDEIGYLPDFDLYFGSLEADSKNTGKQVVITSSSYGTLKQLSSEKLGGGRSAIVELFPLDFEEYLYFSNKLTSYGEEYEPTAEDVSNFYRLVNVPSGMDFIIDKKYMEDTFTDVETARYNQYGGERNIILTKEQYISALDIIAYTLNGSIIGIAKQIAQGTSDLTVGDMDIPALSHIVQALYHNGFLFADLKAGETSKQTPDSIHHDFNLIRTFNDLEQHLKKYNFSVISPLLYTRLLIDIEGIAQMVYTEGGLDGELYELAVKSESVRKNGYNSTHYSYKYQEGIIEVALYDPYGFLMEVTVKNKIDSEHSIDKIFKNRTLIRVLTREADYQYQNMKTHHRIAYPLALLLLSNKKIYKLEATKI